MIEVKRILPQDARQYSDLLKEAHIESPAAFSSSRDELLSIEKISKLWDETPDSSFGYGAFDKDKLIGTVRFERYKEVKLHHKGKIIGIYVTPSCRSKGIGGELIRRVIEQVKTLKGLEAINLSVFSESRLAKSLFKRWGFREYGTELRALKLGDRYYDEILMRLNTQQYPSSF